VENNSWLPCLSVSPVSLDFRLVVVPYAAEMGREAREVSETVGGGGFGVRNSGRRGGRNEGQSERV